MLRFASRPPVPSDVVARIEAQFPLPPAELDRLRARRWILERIPTGGVGAEVGVFRGHFSAMICEYLKPRRLYLIDPWRLAGAHFGWGGAYTNHDTLTTQAAWDQTAARMAQFPATESVMIEGYYPACDDRIPEGLDFAYLDAGHRFDGTLAELRALAARMNPGGVILGDDWRPNPQAAHHGVYRAVQDFVRDTDWEVMVAGPAGQWAIRRRADRLTPSADMSGTPPRKLEWKDVPGSLMPIDQAAIGWILAFQTRMAPPGDLADLTAVPGKCAIAIGRGRQPGEAFTVCAPGAGEATAAIVQPFLGQMPELVDCAAPALVPRLAPGRFRFVHLDGAADLLAGVRDALQPGGVLALARRPGAAPDWDGLMSAGMQPVCHTDFTLYACAGDPAPLQAEIAAQSRSAGWCTTAPPVPVRDRPVFRLHRKT